MRIAIISDIHANLCALEAIGDVLRSVDKIICLGDLVGYYCEVNEVLDFIRPLHPQCLLGNHDRFLLHGCPADASAAVRFGIEYADRVIDPDHRRYLAGLPWCWWELLDERSFFLIHGSPWQPLDGYLYADNPALKKLDEFDYDVIAFGQTHRALQRIEQRPYLLNPGSVGQSRNVQACACALVLDTVTMDVRKLERRFDYHRVIDLAVRNGAGRWVTKHLS